MGISWWAFVGVVAVAYLVPGPDFAIILRSSARGLRTGVGAAVGAQLGLCAHVVMATVGLSIVLARHPELLTAVRILGGLYLLYLGGRLIMPTFHQHPTTGSQTHDEKMTAGSAFSQGLFTNLFNPKAVLFFAAVLPQFLVPGGAPIWIQIAALGLLDVVLGFVAWAVVVALGIRLSALMRRDVVRRWWDRVTGITLGSLGGGMIALERR